MANNRLLHFMAEPPLGQTPTWSLLSRHCETIAYFAAVAAFSIKAATSRGCTRKIAWGPASSMVWD